MFRHGAKNQGFVLVSVLWITAMLTVITLGFGRRAALDRRAAAYALDHSEAMMMARGAVDRGIVEIYNRGLMQLLLLPEERGGTHLGESWAQSKNLFEEGYFERTEEFENEEVIYVIVDEERFIDVNRAPREIFEEMDALRRPVIRRIVARRDEPVHEEEGTSAFHAIEEIRYLQGVREDDWFGSRGEPGLKDLLTVWGSGRININTASRDVLASIPGLRASDINEILNYRAGSDGVLNTSDDRGFRDINHIADELGISTDTISVYCTTTSSTFRITGVATRRQGRIRAVCSAVVSVTGMGGSVILDWQEKTLGS